MTRLLPVVGGGGGAAPTRGWYLAASVDMSGSGGLIADDGTFTAGGITWTFRTTGAGATCTQGVGGITLGGSGTANYTVGALIADVIDDFEDDEPLILAAVSTGTIAGSASSVSVGYWVEASGTLSRGWFGGVGNGFAVGTTLTAINAATEARTASVTVPDPRVLVGYPCRRSGTSGTFISAAALPANPTTGSVYDTMARFGTTPSGSPNWLGLTGYTAGAQTVVVSHIGVYRRAGPAT